MIQRLAAVGMVLAALGQVGLAQEGTGPSAAPPQVAVSPPFVEMQLTEGRSDVQALKLFNFSDQAVQVEVLAGNWDFDESNNVRIVEPTEQSLDQWLLINPLRFEVAPGGFQTVRLAARPRVAPEPGEHRAMVFLRQLPTDAATNSTFRALFRIGVAVYGYMGEVQRVAELHDVSLGVNGSTVRVDFDISSTGNAHIRMGGSYAVWREGDLTEQGVPDLEDSETTQNAVRAAALPDTPVLPGTRRSIVVNINDLEPGEYVLQIQGDIATVSIDRTLDFEVIGRSDMEVQPEVGSPAPEQLDGASNHDEG